MLYKDEILQTKQTEIPTTGFVWVNLNYESKTVQDVILIDIKQFYATIILNALENDLIDTRLFNWYKEDKENTQNNLRWFLENKQLIKSQSETLYRNWLTRVNTLYHKLKTPIPLIYSQLLYNDIITNNKDIIYINVDMIVLLNNNQEVLDKLTQLHKDTRLNQNEFVSVNKLDWFLVKEKQHYIYKLNNIIKHPNIIKDNELNSLKTQITEDIRTIKLNKLFNN
jgi:hypothetical protein